MIVAECKNDKKYWYWY